MAGRLRVIGLDALADFKPCRVVLACNLDKLIGCFLIGCIVGAVVRLDFSHLLLGYANFFLQSAELVGLR